MAITNGDNNDNISKIIGSTPTEIVDDFLLVPQEAPIRPAFYVADNLYTILATTKETGGDFNAYDFFVTVEGGPPPHYHRFEDEVWYITDGELLFNLDDQANQVISIPEGGVVFGPKDEVHQFRNIDSTAAISGINPGSRAFAITVPGALELMFEAASIRAVDRNELIPTAGENPLDVEAVAKFGARIDAPVVFTGLGANPGYEAPENTLEYVVVLPEDANAEVAKEALALSKDDKFSVWTTGEHEGLPSRPTFTGEFGLEYVSLLTFEETGNKFSYAQFTLESQTSETNEENFLAPVVSQDHKIIFVNEGQLSVKIGDDIRVAEEDTFVYIAPNEEYSIANSGDEEVEAIASTVINSESLESLFPDENELFPSPLNSQDNLSTNNIISLSDRADFFDSGSTQDSEGFHRIYGDTGSDEILLNTEDRAFGEDGDDLLDASLGNGHNLLDGGNGNDILIAGSRDQLNGRNGEDILNIYQGSDNLRYGGPGRDQFRIVNGRLPDAVEVQYPDYINDVIPPGVKLPELEDTRNTIRDFELGEDKIHILGVEEIASSFEDLELLPAFGDLGSTSIIATFTENGTEKEISLANVSGVIFNELSPNDFVFV